ncbi:hypothetical protein TA5114_01612 [Cognatishimia activa]|uniref:Uncharacterized protein n=3 Tax=Rhodobacterales TaxID=204455 RepID=A0A0N7MBM3_9RHOB|nr:hypothetical protein THS5294_00029 [Thalassobacter stenotrophicus]CUI93890.1 hypothetical protein TA5113_01831 [Cognatishimia activa]CUK25808.1 hypothetical protein TA5114_01612 [Cognatishimia activa]SHJ38897.1 hypothetical protein SAMN02744035_03584 [Thalassobacter stenotrophicus DSM 16310]
MPVSENIEGKTVARLRAGSHHELVGLLILWETGEVSPLWFNERGLKVNLEWLPGERRKNLDLSFLSIG